MSRYSLRARWVLPIDQPPIAGGYVAVAEGRIAAVDQADLGCGQAIDLGDVVLLPGLVNAHAHLEFSDLQRPLGAAGMSLPEWIRAVIAYRGRGGRDATTAIVAGLSESTAAGVTIVGEIAATDVNGAPSAAPQAVLFQEAIGFSAGRVDSVYADVARRVDAVAARGGLAGISPHAPYTVHPRLLKRLVELATARKLPIAMHLAESREELQLLATGDGPFCELLKERSMWDAATIPRGSRPLDYLKQLTAASRSLAIHGNYLDGEEIALLGANRDRMSVVYCPRTHAYFGHDPYPLEAMLISGVRVALGTDSRASNPDLNLLGELRYVAAKFPAIEPATIVRMATLDAATALGLGDEAGSLAVGKRAELIALRCAGDGNDDPYVPLLNGTDGPIVVPPCALRGDE